VTSFGWRIFRQAEDHDLLRCFENNATRAYELVFSPWIHSLKRGADTIDGLGAGGATMNAVRSRTKSSLLKCPT
jgi:hypothetical protein